jgi:hypothetical protein
MYITYYVHLVWIKEVIDKLNVTLTVHYGTLANQTNLIHFFSYLGLYWELMPLHVSGVTYPSSGGPAHTLLGVNACVRCELAAWIRRATHFTPADTLPTRTLRTQSHQAAYPQGLQKMDK